MPACLGAPGSSWQTLVFAGTEKSRHPDATGKSKVLIPLRKATPWKKRHPLQQASAAGLPADGGSRLEERPAQRLPQRDSRIALNVQLQSPPGWKLTGGAHGFLSPPNHCVSGADLGLQLTESLQLSWRLANSQLQTKGYAAGAQVKRTVRWLGLQSWGFSHPSVNLTWQEEHTAAWQTPRCF